MSTKTFTFDPDAGVPYAANLTIFGGSNFSNLFNTKTVSDTNFDLTGYSGSAQMQKSAGVGATSIPAATFAVGFTSAFDGQFKISLGSTATRNLEEGRYEYNVLVSSGTTIYNIVNGNIIVFAGIASAP
tara:strand:- start:296 stop:682 length:387 start_codon:yes stop_codon:yes gene_type:complete